MVVTGSLAFAGTAFAGAPTSQPAWLGHDSNVEGSLVFYNSSGQIVTGGNNLDSLAPYIVASTAPDASNNGTATLFFATPNNNGSPNVPGSWSTAADPGATGNTFPVGTAPAPLTGPGFANPVYTGGGASDIYVSGHPTTGTAGDGYNDMLQLRLKDGGTHYWIADIVYDPTGSAGNVTEYGVTVTPGSWAVVDPFPVTTGGNLTANPTSQSSPPPHGTATGQTTILTDTISPAEAGTVNFFNGTTQLNATPVGVSGGTAQFTLTNPAFGTYSFSAVFTPAGGVAAFGNTSNTLSYPITAPLKTTSVSLAGPATAQQFSPSSPDWVATNSAEDSTTQAGTDVFTATPVSPTTGSPTQLGSIHTTTASATLHLSSVPLNPGTYNVTAVFTPDSNLYAASPASNTVALTVTAPACKGSPPPTGFAGANYPNATCQDTQNITVTVDAGSITLTTPYTSTNPFVLPDMQLNAGATQLQTFAEFPKATDDPILVHSSLAGNPNWTISALSSNLTCQSGSCTTPITNQYQSICSQNVGLTWGATSPIDGSSTSWDGPTAALPNGAFPGTVTFTDNAPGGTATSPPPGAEGSPVAPTGGTCTGTTGLGGTTPHTAIQSVGGGDGSVGFRGTLSLIAPTATQPGTYGGTIIFTVG